MGGLLQYWNLSGRHQLFGLQSPSQGCSVGSGISSSDRSISNCIYCGYSICNVQVSQKEKRSWGVSDLLTSCPSLALVIDLTNTYRLFVFFYSASRDLPLSTALAHFAKNCNFEDLSHFCARPSHEC